MIWSCHECFSWMHLLCIQKWANDSMRQKKINHENQPSGYFTTAGVFVPKPAADIYWDCPQCRRKYDASEIPRHYECFCGRERQPLPKPFLVPHSCGEICNQPLKPACGHSCLLLCHPGPHPICAQIIKKSCQCGKSPIKDIRCATQLWNCDEVCSKKLPCGHRCETRCHETCPSCTKSRSLSCNCGSQTKDVKCVQVSWSCQKICQKKFASCFHLCQKMCHAGECHLEGGCPFGLLQVISD